MADHRQAFPHGLHRPAPEDARAAPHLSDPDQAPEEGNLLVSPAFWIGGALSILAWIGIAALFGAF